MGSLTPRRSSPARLALALALLSFLALPSVAQAAFPGANGKIAFISTRDDPDDFFPDLFTMNAAGLGQTNLTSSPGVFEFDPVWSGNGTKLVFSRGPYEYSEIFTANADGSGLTNLTNDRPNYYAQPAWSPNGAKIAFETSRDSNQDIWTMNADGTGQARITTDPAADRDPVWSPDGTRIAFTRWDGTEENIWTMNPDGTGQVNLTAGTGSYNRGADWSPDNARIVFERAAQIHVMNADGSGVTSLTGGSDPAWSPDGTMIAFMRNVDNNADIFTMKTDGTALTRLTHNPASDYQPDWQAAAYTGYPRPKGATPVRVPLVVAYESCTAPNRQHGPALAFPSCAPPVQESDWLTTGTADSNGQATEFAGSVRFRTVLGNPATPADEADVTAVMNITDVRNKADMTDYAGGVQASIVMRITDRNNAVFPGGGTDAATVVDIPFPVNASCAPTADPLVGATCAVSTTLDAIVPAAVREGKRAVWQMEQVQVSDGGADGNTGTAPNTWFARQGLFVP